MTYRNPWYAIIPAIVAFWLTVGGVIWFLL
jgi:hypothetical protein